MSESTTVRSRLTRGRVFALLSGGLVLGLGATATLATWSDNEWVFGGVDGATPGIGTSTFEVEQSRTLANTAWDQFEVANGGLLTLDSKALALTPGDSTYTHVSLRSTAASVAGRINLLAATTAGTPQPVSDTGLWAALRLRVVVTTGASPTCSSTSFSSGAVYAVGSFAAPALMTATPATLDSSLTAAAGNQQNYCFEITLPAGSADTLQGKKVTPAWQFHSESL